MLEMSGAVLCMLHGLAGSDEQIASVTSVSDEQEHTPEICAYDQR